jgi:hypothetical protein
LLVSSIGPEGGDYDDDDDNDNVFGGPDDNVPDNEIIGTCTCFL